MKPLDIGSVNTISKLTLYLHFLFLVFLILCEVLCEKGRCLF